MRRRNSLALLVFHLVACSTARLTPDKLGTLRPGTSTRADAVAAFGEPTSISALPNGNLLLQWIETRPTWVASAASHVAIVFTADGRMVGIHHQMFQDP